MPTKWRFSAPHLPRLSGLRGVRRLKRPTLPGSPTPTIPVLQQGLPPPDWSGSMPEWIVFRWLTDHAVEFEYQAPLEGGRLTIGGAVADFILPPHRLVLRVQGEYWHYGDVEKVAIDILQKERLLRDGWNVVDLRERDLQDRPNYILEQALLGIDLSEARAA